MKTVRRPPYPKWNPDYFPCSSLTPLPLSSRRPSVSFGGFGLKETTSHIHLLPHSAKRALHEHTLDATGRIRVPTYRCKSWPKARYIISLDMVHIKFYNHIDGLDVTRTVCSSNVTRFIEPPSN